MTKLWVVLYEGPVWQAKIRQAQLDGYGIPNFVPESDTKGQYLGLAGTSLWNSCVMVPAECAEEARAVLENAPEKVPEDEPS